MDTDSTADAVAQAPERVERTSTNPLDDQVEKLKTLFPECVSEGRVDFEQLRAVLGGDLAGDDAYRLTWSGKKDAFQQVQSPSRGTLTVDDANSVDFDGTDNIFIEGENLEVLKTLYKSYHGRVKMIYIDPPYNTGGDFIYSDDFAQSLDQYLAATGQADGEGNLLTSNPETSGRFHSSWLSMMYPRLFLARQLLRDDGVIFVSIDDNEVHNLRLLMNEVFGEENFVTNVVWHKVFASKASARYFSESHDHILVYAKDKENWERNLLPRTEEQKSEYTNPDNDPRGPWRSVSLSARNEYSDGLWGTTCPGGRVIEGPPRGRYWAISKASFEKLCEEDRIWWGNDKNGIPRRKLFLSDVQDGIVPNTVWRYEDVGHTQEAKKELLKWVEFENTENVFNTVKPPRLIRRMLQIGTDPDNEDIVLDFFAGSAATAQAVVEHNAEDGGNRRFVCVQFPEPLPKPEPKLKTIADIARVRLRNLRDSLTGDDHQLTLEGSKDVDAGFKALRLADSNLRQWQPPEEDDPDALIEQMAIFDDGLKDDVRHKDVLYELILREGFSLNSEVEEVKTKSQMIYKVTDSNEGVAEQDEDAAAPRADRSFCVCLDEEIGFEILDDLQVDTEQVFICRDSALDDALKVNLSLECILKVI